MNLNLENLKIGDEITTVKNNNGKLEYAGIFIIKEWSEKHKGFILKNRLQKTLGVLPSDGKGYYFMSKRIAPDYYYSANPIHIKAAKKRIEKSLKAENLKQKLLNAKKELYSSLLESYRDNEECYSFEYLSTDSLERLTIPQLKKLKGWLS